MYEKSSCYIDVYAKLFCCYGTSGLDFKSYWKIVLLTKNVSGE